MSQPIRLVLLAAGVLACLDQGPLIQSERPVPSCIAAPAGMLAWWPGDGNGSDIVGGLGASLRTGAAFAPGLVTSRGGQAFTFDGVDAMAVVAHDDALNPSSAFSVQAWARSGDVPTPNGAVVAKGDPWNELWVIDHIDGRWTAFVRDLQGRVYPIHGDELVPGAWTHLALTWDRQLLAFYVNGVLIDTTPVPSINATNAVLGIGARSEEGFLDEDLDLEFAGEVDEIAFFGRALSGAEIEGIHAAGALGMCKS